MFCQIAQFFFVLSVPPLGAKMALREFLFHKIQTLVKRKSPDLNQPEKLPHQMEISKSPPATKSFFPLFRRRLRRKNSNESGDLVKAHNQMTKIKHVFFLYAGINIQKLFVMLKLLASFFDRKYHTTWFCNWGFDVFDVTVLCIRMKLNGRIKTTEIFITGNSQKKFGIGSWALVSRIIAEKGNDVAQPIILDCLTYAQKHAWNEFMCHH